MATQTEANYPGDIVKEEAPQLRSRDSVYVDQSQTLVVGTVCKTGTNGRKIALGSPADEVQTISIAGTLTAGSYTLGIKTPAGVVEHVVVPYDAANNAAIQALLDTALGTNAVVVTGTLRTANIFTFSGIDYSEKPQPLIELDAGAATGVTSADVVRTTGGGQGTYAAVDAVQTIGITGTLTAGTFTITLQDKTGTAKTTAAIAYNANNAAIQSALDTLLGTNAVVVGGTAITANTLTFSGEGYEGLPQQIVTIDTSGLTGATGYTAVHTTRGTPASEGGADSVCLNAVTTGSGETTTKGAFVVRDAVLSAEDLVFGSANKQEAIKALATHNIIVREALT